MINVPYILEFSQCSQRFSEWKVVDISGLLLSEFPHCRFQCRCRSRGCLRIHCHSQKLSTPPLPLYPMNFPHFFPSRKCFRYFGILFLFLLNHLAIFAAWLNPYRVLTPQVHLRTYSAHEVWLRHRYVVETHTQVARGCLWCELYVYFEVIVRGESRIKYLWKQPYYAAMQKHVFPKLLGKDDSKHLLSSLLSSLELSFSSCSLSCSSSTKSIFILRCFITIWRENLLFSVAVHFNTKRILW